MIPKYVALMLSFLFIFAFLKPISIFASTYYFQEEFNEARTPNTLDLSKWIIYQNAPNNVTTIQETGGNLQMSQQNNTHQFPLIVSKNGLPEGDFSIDIKFQYNQVVGGGTGFALAEAAPVNGGGFLNVFTISMWQDTMSYKMRIGYGDGMSAERIVFQTNSMDTNEHLFTVKYTGQKYFIYLDERLIYTSQNTTKKVKYLWLGNPDNLIPVVPFWTSFKIDYVRVTALPTPFLDLPWDYESQGSTFNYMALNPYSWFDHQYPLQNECCNWQVMNYTGETIQRPYRSHNGYDYSLQNGIRLNTPVLAAAAGTATFKPWNKSGGAGNVIKIDHGNGYQTWYEHLSSDNLIVSTEGQTVDVEQGQQIGLVGMTGNTNGPHIHFSVFKDSNDNNSFNDEIPYGVTDPLGWSGETTDPWSTWSNGTRSGTTSYNLFSSASFTKTVNIPLTGGVLSTDDTTISVPNGAYIGSFNLIHKIGPFVSLSDYTTGVTPSFSLNAYSNGQPLTQFSKPITITINYSKANLTNIKEETIRIRYFNEQNKIWEELPTTIDTINNTISTEINHLSRFAVLGDTKDLNPPTTTPILTGEKGENDWYRTPVEIELIGNDNSEGVGLEYVLYTLNGEDWFEYTRPLIFEDNGDYQITYQSYDKAENQELRQTLNFHIDKTPPELSLDSSMYTLWPPNGKMADVQILGSASDSNGVTTSFQIIDEYGLIQPQVSNFGQTIQLEAKRNGDDLDGRTYTIEATATDLAGNITTEQAQILVPHDQGKN